MHFSGFPEPKIPNFGNHGWATSKYWVYYKPPVLSYSEVGTYAIVYQRNSVSHASQGHSAHTDRDRKKSLPSCYYCGGVAN